MRVNDIGNVGDVCPRVRFSGDVEALLRVLLELRERGGLAMEEKDEKV